MKRHFLKPKQMVWHLTGHLAVVLATIAASGAIIMFLWNVIIPDIFKLSTINYWQALGLFTLARIFFGTIWRKDRNFSDFRKSGHDFHKNSYMYKKWASMTPEQQRDFINKKRKYFWHKHHDKFNLDPEMNNDKETAQ